MTTTDQGLSHYVGRRRARLSTPAQMELKKAREDAYQMIREAHQVAEDIKSEAQEALRESKEELRTIRIRVGRQRNVLSKVQAQVAEAKKELEALNREKLAHLNDAERDEGRERLRLITSEAYRTIDRLAS